MTLSRRLLNLLIVGSIAGAVLLALIFAGVLGGKGIEAVELLDTPKPAGYEDTGVEAAVGKVAPDFELSDLDGKRYRLSDYRGKVVYINFWATWCEPCITEMPDIYALQEKYKDEIAVISVNRGQKADTARNFLREVRRPDGKTGVSFSVNGLDPTDILYERYRGLGMPLSVFVDRSGMVTEVRNGIMSEAEMERAMDEALSREVQG